MSIDDGLVGHVPYLRRFARALTGSQATGDACVVAALEGVLAGKSPHVPARIALYRSVLAAVNALDAIPVSASPSQSPTARNAANASRYFPRPWRRASCRELPRT